MYTALAGARDPKLRGTKTKREILAEDKKMNALNQIILEGNLTVEPNLREFKNGHRMCTLPIAVNRRFKTQSGENGEEVSFVEVNTYGKLADVCAKWCPKGRGIRVVGRLKQDRWTDENGKNRSKLHVIAEHIEFKPFLKKIDGTTESVQGGPHSASADEKETPSKEEKLAMLAEAAMAAQMEQEAGEEVVF